MAAATPTRQQLLEMYKNSKGPVSSTPSVPTRGFGTDITNNRPQSSFCAQPKSACPGSIGTLSATLKRGREVEEHRSTINELAKRQAHENSPSERFKSFFGASANATPAAAATPSRLRQLLSGSTSTPTAASTPQRTSIVPSNVITTPRSASSRPDPSASPSSQRPFASSCSSSKFRPDATPTRTPVMANKENMRSTTNHAVPNDEHLTTMKQQLQAATQASDTLQKQVEALRAERKNLKEQLAAKDNAMESLQKHLQDERVKTARLGVDNAKLQAELRKLGGGIIAAPSPCVHMSAPRSTAAATPHVVQQCSNSANFFVAPSPKLPQTHSITTAPPPPPPPPPPTASFFPQNKPAPPIAPALAVKPASSAPKQSSASLLSQALSEISSKVNSLRHVPQATQAERRKSSDPSNWIEAALQQRRALIDSSDVNDSNLSVASDW